MALYTLLLVASLLSQALCMPAPFKHYGLPLKKLFRFGLSSEQLQQKQPLGGLPSNSNVQLQYVAMGVGVQNYTCTPSGPKATGAVATLFDMTDYLENTGDVSARISKLYLHQYERRRCVVDADDLGDDRCEETVNLLRFPVLGKHFFASINNAGVPSFDIQSSRTHSSAYLSAAKSGSAPAPKNAYDGANGLGAVDWLFLTSDGTERTNGLSEVYRINTSGGSPDPAECSAGATDLSVKYAAEYWFYM